MTPPTIITDSREQAPLVFLRLPSTCATLTTGDYSLAGFETSFAVERKTVTDLIGSLTAGRDRFMREIDRLRSFEFCRLLVVGSRAEIEAGDYRSAMTPRAALASLHAIEARGVPVAFSPTPETAAVLVETWAVYYFRERAKPFATPTELREMTAGLTL